MQIAVCWSEECVHERLKMSKSMIGASAVPSQAPTSGEWAIPIEGCCCQINCVSEAALANRIWLGAGVCGSEVYQNPKVSVHFLDSDDCGSNLLSYGNLASQFLSYGICY